MAATKKNLRVELLELNEGQMYGLPRNPRWIRDARFEALKKSIEDAPEMLDLREILVYPLTDIEGHEDHYIVIGGNMRLRACVEIGYKEVPCKVLDLETPVKKLREYVIKDNEAFGQNDYDILANEWSDEELADWGMETDFFEAGGEDTDIDNEYEPGEKEPELTDEQLKDLIDKSSAGSISDYSDDTNYDLSRIYREQVNPRTRELLSSGAKDGSVRPEIAELCRMRIAQCTKINFSEICKFYRSDDATATEKELLKRLYLVFITSKEAVEAGMLKIDAVTGRIFEAELSAGSEEVTEEEIEAENEAVKNDIK